MIEEQNPQSENEYEHLLVSVGQGSLFGKEIDQDELIGIISKYPVALWLDILAKIDGFLGVPRRDIDAQDFLKENLFCETTLEHIGRKLDPDKSYVYFSAGQVNLLRKLAIVYGNDGDVDEIPKIDISKALLASQDLHDSYDESVVSEAPDDFNDFWKFALRNGYLNQTSNQSTLFYRARMMYVDVADTIPSYLPGKSFSAFFTEKTGLELTEAMALGYVIGYPFLQEIKTLWEQTTILNSNYFSLTTVDPGKVDLITGCLAIDLEEAKKIILEEIQNKDLQKIPVGYNLNLFRKRPLLRFPDGRVAFLSVTYLFEKMTQNLIWIPIQNIEADKERSDAINNLTRYRGLLFEEYLKVLCSVHAEKSESVKSMHIPPEDTKDNEEVGDAILMQDTELLIFEAKSKQFVEPFKLTGDWEEHIGFREEVLKAANQIQTAAEKIISGKVSVGIKPDSISRIHPIIVMYEATPTHAKIQRFIRQEIAKGGLLTDKIFAPVEIMNIADIEDSVDVANTVTLIELLREKNSRNAESSHASEANFRNFFAQYCREKEIISNGWQSAHVDEAIKGISSFFKDKFKQ